MCRKIHNTHHRTSRCRQVASKGLSKLLIGKTIKCLLEDLFISTFCKYLCPLSNPRNSSISYTWACFHWEKERYHTSKKQSRFPAKKPMLEKIQDQESEAKGRGSFLHFRSVLLIDTLKGFGILALNQKEEPKYHNCWLDFVSVVEG